MKVAIVHLRCKRCSHEWTPRKSNAERCPRCKSFYWNSDNPVGPGRPKKREYECAVCGWVGTGTGNNGKLIEGDRCPECGTYL